MLRTFNCGIGMILVVAPQDETRVLQHLDKGAKAIGALTKRGRGIAVRYKGGLPGATA